MSIFQCLDDPQTGPRLKENGVTDAGLIRYVLDRGNGMSHPEALFELMRGVDPNLRDAEFVGAIIERFPIPQK